MGKPPQMAAFSTVILQTAVRWPMDDRCREAAPHCEFCSIPFWV
jgi:hypothetical protein